MICGEILLQPLKASSPIVIIDCWNVITDNDLRFLKVLDQIEGGYDLVAIEKDPNS